ncbi:hypothetical protein LCGC14_1593000 [marine sediment metagenome]|uniref:Uncharacterized protein n=1 Tax=marine sediment metagenome TaxID=412755 RepID=A0A0F9IDW1_9ZZZZ
MNFEAIMLRTDFGYFNPGLFELYQVHVLYIFIKLLIYPPESHSRISTIYIWALSMFTCCDRQVMAFCPSGILGSLM